MRIAGRQVELETERLALCRPRLGDAAELFGFLGDPQAMRFTQPRTSLRDCRRYLAVHERRRRAVGCAPWVVLNKGRSAIVGYGGLYEDPFDPCWGVEVGYFFAPGAWGKGFASELTRGEPIVCGASE
ncbi:GNAT family N-acetyltransferase [Phenylobacterium sp.]|uniref:GNAT family N-acetyltransferase n=1 Tax=Phenylobacterium sp. TaxID=1871053 RepID=UPI00352514F6